jgi:hypothetical protein
MKYKLIGNITKLSVSNNWEDAKEEWIPDYISISEGLSCLCGKYPITQLCHMRNKINNNTTIVGNCCVTKFLGQTSQIKMFKAISENKINKDLIELASKKYLIVPTEKAFLLRTWRKRKLSLKQQAWFDSLKSRILRRYKSGKLIGNATN